MENATSHTLQTLLRESQWLRALAAQLVSDPDGAEELVQRTQIAALRQPPEGEVGSFRAWLRRVATNLVRQDHRTRVRREIRERAAARDEAESSSAELVEKVEVQRVVAQAVIALNEPYRTTLLLRFYEDLPLRKVARRMGVPVRTAETRLRRGLERLRAELDRLHGGDRTQWLSAVLALADGGGAVGVITSAKVLVAAVMLVLLGVAAGQLGVFSAGQPDQPVVVRPSEPAGVPTAPVQSAAIEPVQNQAEERRESVTGRAATAPRQGGTVEGVVLDLQGVAVPDARVHAWRGYEDFSSTPDITIRSGLDGTFRIVGLSGEIPSHPGRFTLWAESENGGALWAARGLIKYNDVFQGVELRVARGHTIKGQVITSSGAPVVRAVITCRSLDSSKWRQLRDSYPHPRQGDVRYFTGPPAVRTDNQGRFHSFVIGADPFELEVASSDWPIWRQRVLADVRDVRVQLGRGVTLEGRLRADADLSQKQVEIELKLPNGEIRRAESVDAEGRFRFVELTPQQGGFLCVRVPGHAMVLLDHLTIAPGQPELLIELPRELRIRGIVRNLAGQPLASRFVRIRSNRTVSYLGRERQWEEFLMSPAWVDATGPDGTFEFGALPEGKFDIEVIRNGNDVAASRSVTAGDTQLEFRVDL